MSTNRHLAPGVDTTLLKTHFAVVTDAVGALIFPVKSNKFLPTVTLVDIILLKAHFAVVTDAVGALIFPVKSNKFPPTISLVRFL